jgi:hypothetical protein
MEHGYPQRLVRFAVLALPHHPRGTVVRNLPRLDRSAPGPPCFGGEEMVMPLGESAATYGGTAEVVDLAVHHSVLNDEWEPL